MFCVCKCHHLFAKNTQYSLIGILAALSDQSRNIVINLCVQLCFLVIFCLLNEIVFYDQLLLCFIKVVILILSWNRLFDLFGLCYQSFPCCLPLSKALFEHICFLLSFHSLLGVNLQKVFLACFNCEVSVFVESIFKKTLLLLLSSELFEKFYFLLS